MSKAQTITEIRKRIDNIDHAILELINKRAECALEVKKAKGDLLIYRPARESEIKRRLNKFNKGPLDASIVESVFSELIAACRNLEKTLTVAYLGPEGTYSHEAALKMFGSSSDYQQQISLSEVIRSAENGTDDIALLPIENSTEGSVTETHKLLLKTDMQITGEYTLPIKHCLLSTANNLNAIRIVYAHPQALGQCREWLQHHLPEAEVIITSSNARAAQNAKDAPHSAAIASRHAAEFAGIPIQVAGINDFSDNKTRFIALSRYKTEPTGNDKTSVICSVRDKAGALYELLTILAKRSVNLLRLVSQPHADHEYVFYIDMEGHKDIPAIAKALQELSSAAKTCKILGSYPKE